MLRLESKPTPLRIKSDAYEKLYVSEIEKRKKVLHLWEDEIMLRVSVMYSAVRNITHYHFNVLLL